MAVATVLLTVVLGGAIPTQGATLLVVGVLLVLDFLTDNVLGMHD